MMHHANYSAVLCLVMIKTLSIIVEIIIPVHNNANFVVTFAKRQNQMDILIINVEGRDVNLVVYCVRLNVVVMITLMMIKLR